MSEVCRVDGVGCANGSSEVSVRVMPDGDVAIFERLYPSGNLNAVTLRREQVEYVFQQLRLVHDDRRL